MKISRFVVFGMVGWVVASGCDARSSGDDPGDDAVATASSALTGPACTNHNVQVLDVRADFRDIWAGRETAATGKQANPSGQAAVDFSTTVQASFVNATFTPVDTSGKCGGVVAATPGATIAGPAVWGTQTSDLARPTAPSPFNLFVRETASGVVSAGGPVAAGGDVTFSSFSVNGTARQPVGLITGGRATLASGSVTGDLTYGVASTIPGTVTVTGKKSLLPFDVGAAFKNLEALSRLLAGMAPTGTVQSSNGNLQLTGNKSGLNVFQISADALRQASSVAITVPTGASAMIGVSGTSVDIVSKGVSVQGASASTLLWNLADARFLRVASVAVPGSILAPRANLAFDSGSISGTVVARSFLSAGSGSLSHVPLKVSSVFAQSTPSEVALMAASPLVRGCTYQFQIPSSPALTPSGACLAAPLSVTFIVAAHPMTPAARELANAQPDEKTRTLGRFTARTGINTPVEDALTRYESAIGVSTANLVATGAPVASATRRGQVVTQYQQYAQGYPVAGYGYFVASANGIFRSANGRVAPSLPALPVVPAQTITSAAALQKALAFLKITQPPWSKNPAQFKAPVGALVVVAKKTFPAASDFALAWTFPFGKATGIGNPADIQVDAVTGTVIGASPGHKPITFLDERASYQGQVDATVDTIYSGQRRFSAAQYKNLDNSLVTTLTSKGFQAEGALITSTGIFLDSNSTPGGFPQFPLDPTPATPWTTTEPDEQAMASAEWALQLSHSFLQTLGLQVGGNPWLAVDGIGHQRVIVNYVTNASAPEPTAFYYPTYSDADTANIYLVVRPPSQMPVAPDTISHEFSHALLDSLRRGNGLPTMRQIKESGGIDEGLADLYTIAFNHHSLTGVSDPWHCVNFQGSSGGATACDRNMADPHSTGNPDLYLDGIAGFYIDYSNTDPALCNGNVNDACGAHDNSTIVSHWGYLLGVGSSGLARIPCDLEVRPLDADPDRAFRIALNVAYVAAGTRTALGGAGLPSTGTFAQFRDATMQVAEELAAEGTLSADTAAKIGIAWSAVGLPPAGGGPTTAEPANQETGAYPWATFVWPTAGEDGQTGSNWDFQLGVGDLAGGIRYRKSGITETVTRDGRTMGALPLALPFESADTFLWRVRPHSSDPAWATCYPVYSFIGTTEPDPVTNLKVSRELDPETEEVLPGPFTLTWDVVRGTAPPEYNVKIGTRDPECRSGAGITDVPETGLSSDDTTVTDEVDFVTQPTTTYFVNVQPVGPEDFDGATSLGGCFTLEFETTALPPPQDAHPGVVPHYGYTENWTVSLQWATFGGAAKALVYLYDRDENGTCGTRPIGDPVEIELSGTESTNFANLTRFPNNDTLPNPTGYCWNVVAVAANGDESEPSSPKGAFNFMIVPVTTIGPGVIIDLVDNTAPGPLPGGPDTYGTDVTFSWNPTSSAFPTPEAFGIKIGRWPWVGIDAPDPHNCHGNSCQVGPAVADTLFETSVRAGEYVASGDVAAKGRYCWTVWPIYDDPNDPGTAWARQPLVQVRQLCYTSGPAEPTITCDDGPSSGLNSDPITCEVVLPFVPDGQIQLALSGADQDEAGTLTQGCETDPEASLFYADFYDCHLKLELTNLQPNHDYVVRASVFNSDQHPPVMDDTTLAKYKDYPFTTGACGDKGMDCCPNLVCNSNDLVCADDDSATSKHRCKLKPPNLPAPKLIFDTVCDPALISSLWVDDATTFAITDVLTADTFEFEFIDPDTLEVTARGLAHCDVMEGSDLFCPATADSQSLFCTIPANFSFHWSDEKENAANDFAISQRNGFRYAIFHVRARDSASDGAGPYSREGLMVSCIDQTICRFDQENQLIVPHIDTPVPNRPTPIEDTCDDVKFIMAAKDLLPPDACVAW